MDLTKDDLKDFDVVVDAFGVWDPAKMYLHSVTLNHLADILSGSSTRLLVVGGAGSLYTDKTHTMKLSETPDFPKEYLPVANGMGKALDELRKRNDVKWTYISPAAVFDPEGSVPVPTPWQEKNLLPMKRRKLYFLRRLCHRPGG